MSGTQDKAANQLANQICESSPKYSTFEEARDVINHMAHVKMVMNSHKGDIVEFATNINRLIDQLQDETDELADAIRKDELISIIQEAADVQNYLLATVQSAINRYRSRK